MTTVFTSGLQVLLTAHIPPGIHTPGGGQWMYKTFNDILVNTLKRYAHTIVGMHFGHEHSDGFKILSDENGNTLLCPQFPNACHHVTPISKAPSSCIYNRYLVMFVQLSSL